MNTAAANKATVKTLLNHQQRAQAFNLKEELGEAIKKAVNKGLMQTSINVSNDVDPELMAAFTTVVKNLGYKVTVEFVLGELVDSSGGGRYQEPKTVLTVRWG